MNFNQLRVFYEVARRGGFTPAGRRLGISQPAASMQVKALQESLGVRLYRTDGRSLVLTEAGRLLVDYAERLFLLADEAERRLAALREMQSDNLRISTTKTIATYFLPRVMGAFKSLHRGVSIRLDMGTNAWAIETVLTRVSDLGLVVNSPESGELARLTIFEDELVLIMPPSRPLARGRRDDSPDLAAETLIVREEGSRTREATEAALREAGLRVGQTMELADPEAIKNAVRAGLGVSAISGIAVQEEVKAGTLVALPFLGGRVRLRFEAIHRRDVHSPVMDAFLKALVPETGIPR